MAVINDPDLGGIGRRIIAEPGFRPSDDRSLRRAWAQWSERTTPEQRLAAERVWFFEWLSGLYREMQREQQETARVRLELAAADHPGAVPGRVIREDPPPRDDAGVVLPGATRKFTSQSPEWREPERPPAREQEREAPEAKPAPVAARPRDASPRFGPVKVTNLRDQHALVQQPSRKVAAYQAMFPELAFPVATASGPKALADCDGEDLGFRISEMAAHRQALRTATATDEARIEGRERLNARDRVRIAERERNIRDAKATEERLSRAVAALEEHGATVIGELPDEALAACGFSRRVA